MTKLFFQQTLQSQPHVETPGSFREEDGSQINDVATLWVPYIMYFSWHKPSWWFVSIGTAVAGQRFDVESTDSTGYHYGRYRGTGGNFCTFLIPSVCHLSAYRMITQTNLCFLDILPIYLPLLSLWISRPKLAASHLHARQPRLPHSATDSTSGKTLTRHHT